MLPPSLLARLAPTAADPRPVLLVIAGPTAVGKTAHVRGPGPAAATPKLCRLIRASFSTN